MSFMKKAFSSIGIGTAQLDTMILTEECVPGEDVELLVIIEGGGSDQEIQGIDFCLNCTCEIEGEIQAITLLEFSLEERFIIGAHQREEIPLSFELPHHTPYTLGQTEVWLSTGLDLRRSTDSEDNDGLIVVPGELIDTLFRCLNELGFTLREEECEYMDDGFWGGLPLVQEFEFIPEDGPFRGRLDELEVVCFHRGDHVQVLLEIDRKATTGRRLLQEMLEMDESNVQFTFGYSDLPGLTDGLYSVIENWS